MRSEAPWWNAAQATPVQYCRPPYGAYNGTTVSAAGSAGFSRVVLWDVDPQRLARAGLCGASRRTCSRTCTRARSSACTCAPQTAAALPTILAGLKARGYKAVSLPELFRAAGYR